MSCIICVGMCCWRYVCVCRFFVFLCYYMRLHTDTKRE